MAHGGVGSNVFNFGLLFNSLLGVRPTLVPFTGTGPATNALLSGQVDYMCNGIPEAGPHIQAGTLKAFAVGTAERNPTIPNVPTSKEAGLPEFQVGRHRREADSLSATYLIRANPVPTYAQKPRTETEEKARSSERAKEAVR
jgi:tripartite-type tricarboxylate transporter receptor subunit TctC